MHLREVIDSLIEYYGRPAVPPRLTVFEQILWENVAYLADDDRRSSAFALLKKSVGTSPDRILAASKGALRTVTAHGILPDQFAEKLRECARIARDLFAGDVGAIVRLPPAKAMSALRKFPGIGGPGAEKILLFAKRQPVLALESNGMRVLTRIGFAPELKSYAATYRAVRSATADQLGDDYGTLIAAHSILRRHGQELCRRNDPSCTICPVADGCEFALRESKSRPR